MTDELRWNQLATATKTLMWSEPFYGIFLSMLNKNWVDKITARVVLEGINLGLELGREFWDELPPKHKEGLVKHELLHVCFEHLTNYSVQRKENAELLGIAMDLEVNSYIEDDMLPSGGCTVDSFPELNLKRRGGTLYYYEELKRSQNKSPNLQKMIAAMKQGQSTVVIQINEDSKELNTPDHNFMDDLSEANKELVTSQMKHLINEVVEQVQKSRGTIPGEVEELIKKLNAFTPPIFDWKAYLRRFVGGAFDTETKKSRRKLNPRYPDEAAIKIKFKKRILISIDTSGSVSTEELQKFLNEMHFIQRSGVAIEVLQCDAIVRDVTKFDHRADFKVYGRGGTDFQPVIDYYNDNYRDYCCMIFFTDGECYAPTKSIGKMLWVVTGSRNENLIGPQIVIER